MRATRRLKIIAEKHELTVIRFASKESHYCQNCQAETQHLIVAEMAQVMKLSEREVFRLAESEQIHSIETADGRLMVCIESIKI